MNVLKLYSKEPENILSTLSKKLNIKNLFYCQSFHFLLIEFPNFNKLLLYKKKTTLILAIDMEKNIKIFDLENEENLMLTSLDNLIDIEYEYTYILRFDGDSGKRLRISSDDIKIPDLNEPYLKINFNDY